MAQATAPVLDSTARRWEETCAGPKDGVCQTASPSNSRLSLSEIGVDVSKSAFPKQLVRQG